MFGNAWFYEKLGSCSEAKFIANKAAVHLPLGAEVGQRVVRIHNAVTITEDIYGPRQKL